MASFAESLGYSPGASSAGGGGKSGTGIHFVENDTNNLGITLPTWGGPDREEKSLAETLREEGRL